MFPWYVFEVRLGRRTVQKEACWASKRDPSASRRRLWVCQGYEEGARAGTSYQNATLWWAGLETEGESR